MRENDDMWIFAIYAIYAAIVFLANGMHNILHQ